MVHRVPSSFSDNMEMWLVLLERNTGELELVGPPWKEETSGSVVAGEDRTQLTRYKNIGMTEKGIY